MLSMNMRTHKGTFAGQEDCARIYELGMGAPKTEGVDETKYTKMKKGIEDMSIQCKLCMLFGHQKRSPHACGKSTYKSKGEFCCLENVVYILICSK
jgi:hypothetical protein